MWAGFDGVLGLFEAAYEYARFICTNWHGLDRNRRAPIINLGLNFYLIAHKLCKSCLYSIKKIIVCLFNAKQYGIVINTVGW